jgi:hypothetical protein
MSKKLRSLLATGALVGAAFAVVAAPLPASAGVGPGEDRELVSPTSWWAYNNVTEAQVNSLVSANNARLTDVKVTYTAGTPKFTVAMVKNTGAYATSWTWHWGQTPTGLATYASDHNQRPSSVQCYVVSGVTRCASVMIANTGGNAESWKFYYGSIDFIKSKITSSYRLVSFGRILGTDQWSAVLGSNTGTDNIGWRYYYGKTVADLNNIALTNHLRIVDLDRNLSGTYNAIMYSNRAGTPWYTYYGSSLSTLVAKAQQLGQRIFDVTPYPSGSSTLYAVVMVNDLDALSTKLAGVLGPKVPNGHYGFLLKQVGGSQQAGLQTSVAFEPASALKVLYHYTAIASEQAGGTHDADPVAYTYNSADSTNGDICPDDYSSVGAKTLKDADTLMMQQSDNRMTKGILLKYGKAAMLNEATHLNMTHTAINHNIGCPTAATHNSTSLGDLSALYSAYQSKTDITNATWWTNFRTRMLNDANYSGFKTNFCSLVSTEATKLGKSSATATAFCNKVTWIAKGGSYQYGGDNVTSPISWANGSLITIPYKVSGTVTPRAYFYGDYFDQVQFTTASAKSALSTARTTAFNTAMRPYVDAALGTW